jgi:hypothetical protein
MRFIKCHFIAVNSALCLDIMQMAKIRGRNFSVLRYGPVLKIDPYKRKAWNSVKEIELRF